MPEAHDQVERTDRSGGALMLYSKNLATALVLTVVLVAGAANASAEVVSAKLVDFTP